MIWMTTTFCRTIERRAKHDGGVARRRPVRVGTRPNTTMIGVIATIDATRLDRSAGVRPVEIAAHHRMTSEEGTIGEETIDREESETAPRKTGVGLGIDYLDWLLETAKVIF